MEFVERSISGYLQLRHGGMMRHANPRPGKIRAFLKCLCARKDLNENVVALMLGSLPMSPKPNRRNTNTTVCLVADFHLFAGLSE